MPDKSITASVFWDRFGLGVSAICALHCLFFPVLIALLPLTAIAPFLSEWLHPLFILVIAPTVYFASKRAHFDRKIVGYLLSGFLLITAGWLLGHLWLGYLVEVVATVAGSFLLIAGHWLNYRHHRTCNNAAHKHHPISATQSGED
ncbi:MAG: MerC domain-containing protein [Balneolaceae bacterium]|nr:MerC domain-containing protein [Balneolaceae bacterium]MCH8548169.1 MerC domain-containing protein [Balneolaceae bacterium]